MKGIYHLEVYNNKMKFSFDLERKITIIKGNSGTGKSTLVSMISQALSSKRERMGVHLISDAEVIVLNDDTNWETLLKNSSNKIIVADENVYYISYSDFGKAVNESDNYFMLLTRRSRLCIDYTKESVYSLETIQHNCTLLTRINNRGML